MRAQKERGQFGVVLGSGISRPLGFPNWKELVDSLASDSEVRAKGLVRRKKVVKDRSLASLTQLLFQRYKEGQTKRKHLTSRLSHEEERLIYSDWLRLIHRMLYAKIGTDRERVLKRHPYFSELLRLVKSASMTVNYNFDDSLQHGINIARKATERKQSRGYETVWRPTGQFRARDGDAVIYHPNGFLPYRFTEGASEEVVFLDEAFADQLIHTMNGQYSNLLNHLSKNTCLFIGISLSDATLRHLLRQGAVINPGHFHYMVQYVENERDLDAKARDCIFSANFEVYNLITLFLTNNGIRNLIGWIDSDKDDLERIANNNGIRTKHCYYLVGAVGVGKSSTLAHLRSLITHDEWLEERPDHLAKPDKDLTDQERNEADAWLLDQFHRKNWALSQVRGGLHVIDRTPIDPLTFGGDLARRVKARRILKKYYKESGRIGIQPGHIVLLVGNTREIRARLVGKHKPWPVEDIDELQRRTVDVFGRPNVTTINTESRTIQSVVRQVAALIHCSDYSEIDFRPLVEEYI